MAWPGEPYQTSRNSTRSAGTVSRAVRFFPRARFWVAGVRWRTPVPALRSGVRQRTPATHVRSRPENRTGLEPFRPPRSTPDHPRSSRRLGFEHAVMEIFAESRPDPVPGSHGRRPCRHRATRSSGCRVNSPEKVRNHQIGLDGRSMTGCHRLRRTRQFSIAKELGAFHEPSAKRRTAPWRSTRERSARVHW
jgi:hypothetical protein